MDRIRIGHERLAPRLVPGCARLGVLVAACLFACAPVRVRVAGGKVELGEGEVKVGPFEVDRALAVVEEYRRCVAAGACNAWRVPDDSRSGESFAAEILCHLADPGHGRAPANCLSLSDAAAYCAWKGARLLTEAERALLARSTRGEIRPQPSCERPGRDNPFGLCDLGGEISTWAAESAGPDDRWPSIGIRCARSLAPGKPTGVPKHLQSGVRIIQIRPPD